MNNIFEEDTSYYKKLLDVDSNSNNIYTESIEAEIVEDNYINDHTSNGFSKNLFNDDALNRYAKLKNESDAHKDEINKKANEVFVNLFNDLNAKYGLDIKFSIDSFKQSIEYIIEPSNQKAFDLYVSEAYSRVRSSSYMKMLQAVVILTDQLFDPKFLLSESMTYEAKFKVLNDLFDMMTKIEDIYETIKIKDADIKLKQISNNLANGPQQRSADSLESRTRLGQIFDILDKRALNKENN